MQDHLRRSTPLPSGASVAFFSVTVILLFVGFLFVSLPSKTSQHILDLTENVMLLTADQKLLQSYHN
jgi:hypothetical protein